MNYSEIHCSVEDLSRTLLEGTEFTTPDFGSEIYIDSLKKRAQRSIGGLAVEVGHSNYPGVGYVDRITVMTAEKVIVASASNDFDSGSRGVGVTVYRRLAFGEIRPSLAGTYNEAHKQLVVGNFRADQIGLNDDSGVWRLHEHEDILNVEEASQELMGIIASIGRVAHT